MHAIKAIRNDISKRVRRELSGGFRFDSKKPPNWRKLRIGRARLLLRVGRHSSVRLWRLALSGFGRWAGDIERGPRHSHPLTHLRSRQLRRGLLWNWGGHRRAVSGAQCEVGIRFRGRSSHGQLSGDRSGLVCGGARHATLEWPWPKWSDVDDLSFKINLRAFETAYTAQRDTPESCRLPDAEQRIDDATICQ